jgi:hypothetical protein
MGEGGQALARVLTTRPSCPEIVLDGQVFAMLQRAPTETIPQRATRSAPADSKPSAFDELTCERSIPAGTRRALVGDEALPLPAPNVRRIVVIGDTGCRLKRSDLLYQACDDPERYPFATIALRAAHWHPDLVIHVGDYLYRENPCPLEQKGCAGSPWGYGSDAWRADFFQPARSLLLAAPWVVVRGNHESCARAGQGWWRYLDPRAPLAGQNCNNPKEDVQGDYSDPYAVPLGNDWQLIVLDTSATPDHPLAPADPLARDYTRMAQRMASLSSQSAHNIVVDHHPILGFAGVGKNDPQASRPPGSIGVQSVLARENPQLFPEGIDLLLSGHVHLWEEVSFGGAYPSQFVAGFSGTEEEYVPLPAQLRASDTPYPGAVVDHFSSWSSGFGFMTLERIGNSEWDVGVWNVEGVRVNHCHIEGRQSSCELTHVP